MAPRELPPELARLLDEQPAGRRAILVLGPPAPEEPAGWAAARRDVDVFVLSVQPRPEGLSRNVGWIVGDPRNPWDLERAEERVGRPSLVVEGAATAATAVGTDE